MAQTGQILLGGISLTMIVNFELWSRISSSVRFNEQFENLEKSTWKNKLRRRDGNFLPTPTCHCLNHFKFNCIAAYWINLMRGARAEARNNNNNNSNNNSSRDWLHPRGAIRRLLKNESSLKLTFSAAYRLVCYTEHFLTLRVGSAAVGFRLRCQMSLFQSSYLEEDTKQHLWSSILSMLSNY